MITLVRHIPKCGLNLTMAGARPSVAVPLPIGRNLYLLQKISTPLPLGLNPLPILIPRNHDFFSSFRPTEL